MTARATVNPGRAIADVITPMRIAKSVCYSRTMQDRDRARAVLSRTKFISFDGAVCLTTARQRPDRYRHLELDLGSVPRIARGAGLSYVAASFGPEVIVQEMASFNRLLAFDAGSDAVRVEAGVTLARLLEWAASESLYLPVLPGHPLITVGGCIAADVHGKNPARDGTFCDWVISMTLFHPDRGLVAIDRGSDPDLFELTCGGFGLTGVVVDATLRLVPHTGRRVHVRTLELGSLPEALERLRSHSNADFAYTWHDGSARGTAFGRGLCFFGSWCDEAAPPEEARYSSLSAADRARWPLALWNTASIPAANAFFRRLAAHRSSEQRSAFDASFPLARRTLYHRLYGRRGLMEAQLLVPDEQAERFTGELRRLIDRVNPLLVMMSMKRFTGRRTSLSLSGSGMLIALDLVRNDAARRFVDALDELTLAVHGQPNIAKDSRLPATVAARALPGTSAFVSVCVRTIRDGSTNPSSRAGWSYERGVRSARGRPVSRFFMDVADRARARPEHGDRERHPQPRPRR